MRSRTNKPQPDPQPPEPLYAIGQFLIGRGQKLARQLDKELLTVQPAPLLVYHVLGRQLQRSESGFQAWAYSLRPSHAGGTIANSMTPDCGVKLFEHELELAPEGDE